jgi:hypothetical protein
MLWPAHGLLLDWDEVDYVNAARLGPLANTLDIGSLSPREFVRFALAKRHGTAPSLPDGYEEQSDPLVLRHYHPPFVVILLSLISSLKSERALRLVQLVGSLLFVAVILFSLKSITGSVGWTELLVVSLLTLQLIQLSFGSIAFHGWEGVWSTASAAMLSKWLRAPRPAIGFLLCAAAALALVTLETGAVVWIGILICLFVWSPPRPDGRPRISWRQLAVGFGVTLVFVLFVWPGAAAKTSLLKIVAFHVYRVGRGEEYAETLQHLARIIWPLLPVLALSLLSAAYLLWRHRSESVKWGPFLVVGVLYGISVGSFAIGLQYLVPALAPLLCVVGFAAYRIGMILGSYFRVGLAGLVALLVFPVIWPGDRPAHAQTENQMRRAEVRWLANLVGGRDTLIDGGHVYQYYLGPEYSIQPITVAYDGKELLVRTRGRYRALRREDVEGRIVVIQNDRKRFLSGPVPSAMLADCPRINRPIFRVYDCSKIGKQPVTLPLAQPVRP